MMSERTTCVISGAGPAGMVLGLLLARAGIAVTVLEKHEDFLRDFRGDTVHPSTMRLLDELGLGADFDALPQNRLQNISFPSEDGGRLVLGDLSRLDVDRPYIAMVPQWDLLSLLATSARTEPGFELRMNSAVTGLLRDGENVVGVRYLDWAGNERELHADLTVAADGRHSTVREQSGLPLREYPVGFDAWWLRLPRYPEDSVDALIPAMERRQFAVIIPRAEHYQIAYIGPKGTDSDLRSAGIAAFRNRLASAVPWLADRVDELSSTDEVKHLDVRLNRLRRWHTAGLLCIGDAAHAMSPVGGVGINLAVQDAVATARLLAAPLGNGDLSTTDLAGIEARRRIPTAAAQFLQRILHHTVVHAVINGRRDGPPRALLSLFRGLPRLTAVPARLIGIGIRPEHAPDYARPR